MSTIYQPVEPLDGYRYYGDKPAKAKSELDMEAFLRLLAVQMENQNPLEPMNDRDFFAQMAQLGQVQGTDQMKALMERNQAAELIGSEVVAVRPMTDNGTGQDQIVQGVVQRYRIQDGEELLTVREANGGEVEIKLANIQQVLGKVEPGMGGFDDTDALLMLGKKVTASVPQLDADGNPILDNAGKPKTQEVTGVVKKIATINGLKGLLLEVPGQDKPIAIGPDQIVSVEA